MIDGQRLCAPTEGAASLQCRGTCYFVEEHAQRAHFALPRPPTLHWLLRGEEFLQRLPYGQSERQAHVPSSHRAAGAHRRQHGGERGLHRPRGSASRVRLPAAYLATLHADRIAARSTTLLARPLCRRLS